jgi:hypothetical protein
MRMLSDDFRDLCGQPLDDAICVLRWHALQKWLATGPTSVAIPFADQLAKLVPPVAPLLRRDFRPS